MKPQSRTPPPERVVDLDGVRLVIPDDQAEQLDRALVAWLLEQLEVTPE